MICFSVTITRSAERPAPDTFAASADGINAVTSNQHRAVFDDRKLAQIAARAWPAGAGKRYQLRTINDCESFRHGLSVARATRAARR